MRCALQHRRERLWPGARALPGHGRYARTLREIASGRACTLEIFRPPTISCQEENVRLSAEVTKAHVAKYWP
jgi:2-keto-myo-inositol isomerase